MGCGVEIRHALDKKPKKADYQNLICEEVCRIHQARILLEVELVKAHRTKKDKQEMALLERCVTEGHEKASGGGKNVEQ